MSGMPAPCAYLCVRQEEQHKTICVMQHGKIKYEMQHKKEKVPLLGPFLFHAEDGSRTHKVLLPHGPEPCASANSATSARTIGIITHFHASVNTFFKKMQMRADGIRQTRPGGINSPALSPPPFRWRRAPPGRYTGSPWSRRDPPGTGCAGSAPPDRS